MVESKDFSTGPSWLVERSLVVRLLYIRKLKNRQNMDFDIKIRQSFLIRCGGNSQNNVWYGYRMISSLFHT